MISKGTDGGEARTKVRVVSALEARSRFGALLQNIEDHSGSIIIQKRGTPRAIVLSLRDYVRLAAPEPHVLKLIGEESRARGTDRLTSGQVEQVITRARSRAARPR